MPSTPVRAKFRGLTGCGLRVNGGPYGFGNLLRVRISWQGFVQQQHSYSEIEQALSTFTVRGEAFELRLLHGSRKRVDAGYFDNIPAAATAIAALNEQYTGIYFTPNPVNADLMARSYNRISPWVSKTTLDPDISRRRWLLIDVDPDRVAGISSTDNELDNAFKVAKRIQNTLELEGWPVPFFNMSGNGYHLLYRINEPNTEIVRDEIALLLKCLNVRFATENVSIDPVNFNAARIFRLPGTWARKGDSIPGRPHRKAYQLSNPLNSAILRFDQITQFNDRFKDSLTGGGSVLNTSNSKHKVEYPEDEKKYRSLNDHAMKRMPEWVPLLFPAARQYKSGYRISSADLGLTYEEDLAIHPWPLGIKYFGSADQGDRTEGRRMPVGLVSEFVTNGDKELAARKLADILRVAVTEFSTIEPTPSNSNNLPGTAGTARKFDFSKVPTMAQLQREVFKPQKWVIKSILPTGNTLLASRPKMRKTFLALQLSLAVCTGDKFLGWEVEKGDVLFLGLEDNKRRLQSRIKLLQTFCLAPPSLDGFRYWTGGVDISPTTGKQFVSNPEEAASAYSTFPRGEAGVEALHKFLDQFPNTRLIVIDTYAHFREQSNNRDVYQRDYDQMMPITRLCAQREVAALVVHHEKKGLAGSPSGDFMEDISGTTGITGAVDAVMSIKGKRGSAEENETRQLMLSGRDVPHDIDVDMSFDAQRGGWRLAARQNAREAILSLLKQIPYAQQRELQHLLPTASPGHISRMLTILRHEGLVINSKYGYSLSKGI